MVKDLEELLRGPLRRRLRPQIVENEQRRSTHALEEIIERCLTGGAERGAQVIEQVGNDDEDGRLAQLQATVANGRGEMRLTRAKRSQQHEPAFRALGELARAVVRVLLVLLRTEGGERLVPQSLQVAVLQQHTHLLVFELPGLAGAGHRLTEAGIVQIHLEPQPAGAAARRTATARRGGRICPGGSGRDRYPAQNVAHRLHGPCPRSASGAEPHARSASCAYCTPRPGAWRPRSTPLDTPARPCAARRRQAASAGRCSARRA